MISVLVLTKNEEKDLPGCLQSVQWSDDIHVYDSYSDDRTVEIAEAFGASVTKRHFDNWAAHQNWGLRNIAFRHPWVFYIDADERASPALAAAMLAAAKDPGPFVAFRVQRRDYFLGRWLKHVQATSFYMRLFRPNRIRYERLVNPVSLPDGPVGEVSGFLDHFPFSKGISHWLGRHNAYSSLEAQQIVANRTTAPTISATRALFDSDYSVRRFHQKEIFYRMPARPLIKFLLLYFLKRGLLDGRPGFVYSVLQSFYEYMIVLKVRELEASQADPASSSTEKTA